MSDVLRIFGLWRGRAIWLAAGVVVSLAALATGVALMAVGGATLAAAAVAGVLAAPASLRGLGVARVVLRYLERLVTHDATFRALADLRVWFFRNLARGAAGGLGFRQAGDVLARLVADIEALDGLYLRILVPLAGAAVLLPALLVLIGVHNVPLALLVGLLFAVAAFVLPWFGARLAADAGRTLAATAGALRITALDTLTGLREVRAFGAEGRMLAAVQAREAALLATQHALASRTALAGAGAFLCGQCAVFAVLAAAGGNPVQSVIAAFLVVAAFEAVGGLPRAGVLAGHAAAAAHRVLEAAEAPVPVPDPAAPGCIAGGFCLALRGGAFPLASGSPVRVRRSHAGSAARRARGAARSFRCGKVYPRGAGAEGGGAATGTGAAGRRRYCLTGGSRCADALRLAVAGDSPVR